MFTSNAGNPRPQANVFIPGVTQASYAQKLAEKVPTLLAIAGALLVLMATLFPFDFYWPAGHSFSDIARNFVWDITRHSTQNKIYDITTNIVLFIPLGLGVAARIFRGGWRRRHIALIGAAAAGFVLSATVEILQLFLAERDASLIDILSNTTGALIGGVIVRIYGERMLMTLPRWMGDELGRPSARLFGTLLGLWIAWPIFLALAYAGSLTLDTWDPTARLLVANEVGGRRPWHGRVAELHLADRAFDADQIAALLNGADIVDIAGDDLLASYVLHGPRDYEDATERQPPLAWVHEQNVLPDGTPVFKHARYLATPQPPRELVRAIRDANAFTLVTTIATNDPDQFNDVRIISLSNSETDRNLTLAQDGPNLNIRLRNGVTGFNGRRPQLLLRNVFVDQEPHRLIVTCDHGTVRAYVDDISQAGEVRFTPPLAVVWRTFPRPTWAYPMQGASAGVHTWLLYVLAFVPLGVLAAVQSTLIRHRYRPWLFTAAVVLPPAALQLLFWIGYDWRPDILPAIGTFILSAASGTVALTRLKTWRRQVTGV